MFEAARFGEVLEAAGGGAGLDRRAVVDADRAGAARRPPLGRDDLLAMKSGNRDCRWN